MSVTDDVSAARPFAMGTGVSPDVGELYRRTGVTPGVSLTGGGFAPPDEPKILWGYRQARVTTGATRVSPTGRRLRGTIPEGMGPAGTRVTAKQKVFVSFEQALADIYSWSDKKFEEFANQLIEAGRIPHSYTRDEVIAQWQELVRRARETTMAGRPMTPWDILAFLGSGPGGGPPSPKTVVQKQVRISTPEEARAILRATLASYLGRAPSETELDDFQANLNQAQRQNPVVTTTTTSPTGELVSSTTTGGVDAAAFAQQFAEERFGGEQDAFQAGTLYLPELLRIIESPVD